LQKYQQEWQQTMRTKEVEKKADEGRLAEMRSRVQQLQQQREDSMRRVGQMEAQEQVLWIEITTLLTLNNNPHSFNF
jgi:hypothetical protein